MFYPQAKGKGQWYELGVTPTLEGFFEHLPLLKKQVTSPTGAATFPVVRYSVAA